MAISQDDVNIVITGDASQAMQEIRKVEASVNGLLSLQVGKSLETGFGSIFKSIASSLSKVAQAVSGIVNNALNIGGGFEAQMTSVKIISGATADELDKLTAKAREMGAALPITAKDAAQAMELLAQRGTQAKDILVTVADVSALAISQNVDMASAADLLGATMTNFGIAVQDAAKVTDIFNNACNQSALSMSKIINAMKYVGPAAGAVGMDLTEAVSALEVLTNAGLTGEMAGAGLALVLNKLSSEAHVLGVDTKNLDGSMRSLKDIFYELQQKGFSLAEATALFGMRGNKAAIALAKYSATLELNQANLQKWGATQNAVTEKMKTWTNIWNSFQSATEEFHIEVFEQIKNQAKDSVNVIAELTREFSKWVGETQIAGEALNAFLEGLGFKLPSVENLQSLLRNFNVQDFLNNVKSFGSAIKGIADSIIGAFNMIKAPLAFLIEHLGAFAAISFWGWIIGKGMQVPAAIMGIATSFKQLYEAAKLLFGLSWGAILNPLTATIAASAGIAVLAGATVLKAKAADDAEKEFNDTVKRIQNEIKQADDDLTIHINTDFITGFEKLPASYFKASDQLRDKTNSMIRELQSAFRDKYAVAVKYVADTFPDLAAEALQAGIDIDNAGRSVFLSLSSALRGSEEDFKALPAFFQKIVEHINLIDIHAGKGNLLLRDMILSFKKLQDEADKMKPQNKVQTFFEDISANLRNVLDNLPKQIDEANKYLNGSDGQLAIKVSLKQATDSLNAFVKDTADKFAIPEDIVKQSTLNRLKELAAAGNKTAQELAKAWGEPDSALEDFIGHAKDAITYLGASPQQFMPALNSMLNGIQKIDPVTGKLNENFKKAHDALKELANVTFDNLTNRIQKLRKAVEGGFIDQSVLEKEIKDVMPQIKMRVVSELEPMKNQFHSHNDYLGALASEFVAQVQDLFGDFGNDFLRNSFNGKSGTEIGRSILRDSLQDSSSSRSYININGIEQSLSNAVSPFSDKLKLAADNFGLSAQAIGKTGDSILSLINSIRTPSQNDYALSTAQPSGFNHNFNEALSSLILHVQNINSALDNLSSIHQNNSNALDEVLNAVRNLNNAIAALNSGNTFNIDIHQQGFNVLNKSDADFAANSAVNALRSGLGNGGL